MNSTKPPLKNIFVYLPLFLVLIFTNATAQAQDRARVVERSESSPQTIRPSEEIPDSETAGSRRILSNKIVVASNQPEKPLIKKTSSSRLTAPASSKTATSYYSATARSMMMHSIRSKMGIRYVLGTQGPNAYDCSGFVWKVFQESGIDFTRTSARSFWQTFEPVYGDERFEFGTLVFFNNLGHVGIVADENGFYHASSSKGITYSKFEGYWGKRIVGYRRVPLDFGSDWEIISEEAGK